MKQLTDDLLIDAYTKANQLQLDSEFILLLVAEMTNRGLKNH